MNKNSPKKVSRSVVTYKPRDLVEDKKLERWETISYSKLNLQKGHLVGRVPKNYNPTSKLYVNVEYPNDWSQIRVLQDSYYSRRYYEDSFDPDADENNPILLHRTKVPDMVLKYEEPQREKRKRYIPKKLIKFYQTSLLESEETKSKFCSEVKRAYSVCLRIQVSLGQNIKAKNLLAALIVLFVERNFENTLGQDEFFTALLTRCRANNYQGDWAKIAQIIQLSGCPTLVKEFLLEQGLGTKRFDNDYLPKGQKILSTVIKLRYFDKNEVLHPKFKSGYSRSNSQKEDYVRSPDEGSDSLIKSSKFDRDITVPLTPEESTWFWSNGNPLPVREVEYFNGSWGESIFKEITENRRKLDMKAEIAQGVRDVDGKRIKVAAAPITSGYLSEEHLQKYIKIKETERDHLQELLDAKNRYLESLKKSL